MWPLLLQTVKAPTALPLRPEPVLGTELNTIVTFTSDTARRLGPVSPVL